MSDSTDIDVDLSVLEELDFEVQCEHQGHDRFHVVTEPASWIMSFACPVCGPAPEMLFCDSGKQRIMTVSAITHGGPDNPDSCGQTHANEEWAIHARPLVERIES